MGLSRKGAFNCPDILEKDDVYYVRVGPSFSSLEVLSNVSSVNILLHSTVYSMQSVKF